MAELNEIQGRRLVELLFAEDVDGAEVYGEQGGQPRRLKVGAPNGLAGLDHNRRFIGGLRDIVSVKDPQFGAVGDGITDDTAAIQAALDASLSVYFPYSDYLIAGWLKLRSFQILYGPDGFSQESTAQGAGQVARLLFAGAGAACIAQADPASNLLHAGLLNMTIRCTGAYTWIFDFTTVIGLKMVNVLAGSTNMTSGVMHTAKIGGAGFSWANHFQNVHFRVPIGSAGYVIDTDTSDTPWIGGTLGGGQGVILRGTGGWKISEAIINNATIGITLSVETESLSQHIISGCQIEENSVAGVLLDGDADDTLVETDVNFVISGCQLRNPAAGVDIKFQNATGPILKGGVISGCMFTAPTTARISRDQARWKHVTVSGNTQNGATVAQNNYVGGQFLASPLLLAQSAVAATHTGSTVETTLATIAVPANAMGPNGRLRVTTLWSHTNSVNAKNLRVRFNGTYNSNFAATTATSTRIQTEIANRNATNSQVSPAAAIDGSGSGPGPVVTSAHDTTTALNIVIAALLANAADSVTLESYLVELVHGE